MIVSYDSTKKMFIAKTANFEEGRAPKQAGFLWDKIARHWFTKFPARAAMLRKACDDSALAVLENHFRQLEESRATDASIEVPAPERCSYLPYQKAGIKFMADRPNSLNADEPGLGKTIQVLGSVNADPTIRRVLIVAPVSLIRNWEREASKWLTRKTHIELVEDNDLPRYVDILLPDLETADSDGPRDIFVITNYERLLRNKHLQETVWDLVVSDEVHYIKNPVAKRSIAVYRLNGKRKMGLSGTPLLNRPIELQPIAGWLDPERFGNPLDGKKSPQFWHFAKRYCAAHKEPRGPRGQMVWVYDGASNLDELQERLRASIMIRRLKQDVLSELPPKRRSIIPLDTTWVDPDNIRARLEELEAAEAELRLARTEEDKAAYSEAAKKLKYAGDVAFEEMARYRHELALSKVDSGWEYINTLLESGVDKVIVFAHHRDVLEKLFEKGTAGGYNPGLIYGGMSTTDRDAVVQRFQSDPACRIFFGGIQAAAEGLTLTAASHVVFVEVDWVPAKITQAEDRAHRIGQKDIVFVHQLIVDNTLDAYMVKKVVWKQEVADAALDIVPKYEELDVEMSDPADPKKIRTTVRKVAEKDRLLLLEALRLLSAMCDGARQEDQMGFNKLDTAFGKRLATLADLTDAQFYAGWRMVRKYRRQLPGTMGHFLGFYVEEKVAGMKKAKSKTAAA